MLTTFPHTFCPKIDEGQIEAIDAFNGSRLVFECYQRAGTWIVNRMDRTGRCVESTEFDNLHQLYNLFSQHLITRLRARVQIDLPLREPTRATPQRPFQSANADTF